MNMYVCVFVQEKDSLKGLGDKRKKGDALPFQKEKRSQVLLRN